MEFATSGGGNALLTNQSKGKWKEGGKEEGMFFSRIEPSQREGRIRIGLSNPEEGDRKGRRNGRKERERVVLPWGRGVGAWGRLVGPGVGVRIRCTEAGRRRCPPSMDHQDPYPRRSHLKQERRHSI